MIIELLKGANLETMTAKKVRKELETQFGTDLQDRKKEINKMIEDIINAESSGSDDDKAKPQNGRKDSSGSESDIVDRDTGSKKAKPTKKRRDSSAASDSDNDAELARKLQAEEESKTKRSTRSNGSSSSSQKPKKKKKKRKADSDDSDGDAPAKKKATGGYLKPLPLSYELSEFTGEKEVRANDVRNYGRILAALSSRLMHTLVRVGILRERAGEASPSFSLPANDISELPR